MANMLKCGLLVFLYVCAASAKMNSEEFADGDSGDQDLDSSERIGATVTQIYQHPYAAILLNHDNYTCSAVILNTYWLLTLSKCFDSGVISSYVTHRNLGNYTIRVGNSYNNKGGIVHTIKMLINNFDLRVSAAKLEIPLVFSSSVQSVALPRPDEEAQFGYLASIIAWTPSGHMRVVNAPVIQPAICEADTKMLPGHYICIGGVQDPNRHFCRRDNGGAVIQNNTLIGVSSFLTSCALYTKTHAFPKVSSFSRWLDSVIWDEENRPSTETPKETTTIKQVENNTEPIEFQTFYPDPSKFMLTLPFAPVNVPLEPAEDNSVIPRMSLYESYLQSLARSKTTTTERSVEERRYMMEKYNKALMMMGPQIFNRGLSKKYDQYDYNK